MNRTGDNLKYGKLISDGQYIERVKQDMQEEINNNQWTEDKGKEEIIDKLEELEIYSYDIDYIVSELNFK